MKVLHIPNDYSGSKVYKNLFIYLDSIGVEQTVYTAVRSSNLVGRNQIDFNQEKSKVIYRHILNIYTRLSLKVKIKIIFDHIQSELKINEYNLVHAHTLFSDGSVAYELHKKYNIPYVVTVRNTDLNIFFKYMIHLRKKGIEILLNAKKIIFISPVYLQRLYKKEYMQNYRFQLQAKSVVIPNGIDDFWIYNVEFKRDCVQNVVQLLYIGKFNKGKNVLRLCKAVQLLNDSGIKYHLSLVGGEGSSHNKIMEFIKNKSFFTYHGKIHDKVELKKIFINKDIFTMPSRSETFGLVYVEALSQGLPIVYTVNEGIYGFYNESIGEAVNYKDIHNIANAIEKISNNYKEYAFNSESIVSNHNWKDIANKYLFIYNHLSNENTLSSSIF